jgi:Holliday junction DNA helicase RuvB
MTESTEVSIKADTPKREDFSLRPHSLETFIGQQEIKRSLGVMIDAARKRGDPLEHVLFHGPPGLGKTTLAVIIAAEMEGSLRELAAPSIQKVGDLATVLSVLGYGDVLFLDEIHRMKAEISEILYAAMEDFKLSIQMSKGEKPMTVHLKHFTLVGATTDYGTLPGPLRGRFGQVFPIDLYSIEEIEQVVLRAAGELELLIDKEAARLIAERSRGTPRVSLRLLRRCRDLAEVQNDDLTGQIAAEALELLRVDERGLDETDRRYLWTLADRYGGGPVGPKSLSASSGIDSATIEHAIEPWLLRAGLIVRTRRGRKITRKGHRHISDAVAAGEMSAMHV